MSQLDIFGGEILMTDQTPAPPREHDWKSDSSRARAWERCAACGLERLVGRQSFALVPCPGEISIYVSAETDGNFQPGDVWPDGDWPEHITTEAVLAQMRKQNGGLRHGFLDDWGLDLEFHVQVEGQKAVRTSD